MPTTTISSTPPANSQPQEPAGPAPPAARAGPFGRFLPAGLRAHQEKILALWGRYFWFGLVNQVILGLLGLYWVIQWVLPDLSGWQLALALFILGCGVVGGRYVGRRVEIYWTESGGSFEMASLWRAFLLLVPVFLLRTVLVILDKSGTVDTAATRRMLLFFVPGMLTTRATIMLVKMFRVRKEFIRERVRRET